MSAPSGLPHFTVFDRCVLFGSLGFGLFLLPQKMEGWFFLFCFFFFFLNLLQKFSVSFKEGCKNSWSLPFSVSKILDVFEGPTEPAEPAVEMKSLALYLGLLVFNCGFARPSRGFCISLLCLQCGNNDHDAYSVKIVVKVKWEKNAKTFAYCLASTKCSLK